MSVSALRWSALVLALSLALVAGCAIVPEDPASSESESEEATEQPVEPAMPAEEADFSYLNGAWVVEATLTDIDEGAMRESADRPNQRWECVVDGQTMTLVTDTHIYAGTIEPELDEGWVFIALSIQEDEDGVQWTNAIEVHGKRTGDATFAGGMELTVDSSSSGHRYAATWDIKARRQ